jgi:hypothetical protein
LTGVRTGRRGVRWLVQSDVAHVRSPCWYGEENKKGASQLRGEQTFAPSTAGDFLPDRQGWPSDRPFCRSAVTEYDSRAANGKGIQRSASQSLSHSLSHMFAQQFQPVTQIAQRFRLEGALGFLEHADGIIDRLLQLRTTRTVDELTGMWLRIHLP